MHYNCIVVGNVAWLVNSVIKYHVFCLCFLVCSTNRWKPRCWIIQSLILAANAIVTIMVLNCNWSYAANFDIWQNIGKYDQYSRNHNCDIIAKTSKTFISRPQLRSDHNFEKHIMLKTWHVNSVSSTTTIDLC